MTSSKTYEDSLCWLMNTLRRLRSSWMMLTESTMLGIFFKLRRNYGVQLRTW